MEEHKTPQEDYSFMQEVIKDETDSPEKVKSKVFKVAGYGILLGLAASVAFCASKPWIETRFHNNPSQVEIPKDEEADSSQEELGKEEQHRLDADDYRRVVQTLNTTAAVAKKSMASVTHISDGTDGAAVITDYSAGVIIADNGSELLVFANIMPEKEGTRMQITFSDGKTYPAVKKMSDYNTGFCIYAVSTRQLEDSTWETVRAVTIGSSASVESGTPVIVMGAPFGADNAVSYGVVTADEEYAHLADGDYKLLCTNISGSGNADGSGVILNRHGQLIGMINQTVLSEASRGRVGGFGISDIKEIMERLSNGSMVSYAGIYGMDVTEELMKKGMPQGVYVKEVAADSPAMAAGIQSGDVLVALDGESIVNLSSYHSILMEKEHGREIKLSGCRQGAGDEYVEIEYRVKVGSKSEN